MSESLKHPLPIAEFFGQCDHNALGAAEVTESVHVLVLRNFANKFGPVLLQASNDVRLLRSNGYRAWIRIMNNAFKGQIRTAFTATETEMGRSLQ